MHLVYKATLGVCIAQSYDCMNTHLMGGTCRNIYVVCFISDTLTGELSLAFYGALYIVISIQDYQPSSYNAGPSIQTASLVVPWGLQQLAPAQPQSPLTRVCREHTASHHHFHGQEKYCNSTDICVLWCVQCVCCE